MEKKTPLYEVHRQSGGRLVPFAGYLLPVQYVGVIAEHMAVRRQAGLFDVSHMGEIFYEGPDALANLNHLLANDLAGMPDGRVRYSVMLNEAGGVVDDLVVYKFSDTQYMTVVNAANREKDVAHMREQLFGDVSFADRSDAYAQLALQGPATNAILERLAPAEQIPQKYYTFMPDARVGGIPCILSRTGYTGEDGVELYLAPGDAPRMWALLLEAGASFGLVPCGLGARDTLRLEAGMPLYGHEMDETVSPLETGLGFSVKMNKDHFVGKAGLERRGTPAVVRIGLRVTGRGIIREDCDIYLDGRRVGRSTSGTHCPFLGYPAAMALVDRDCAAAGTALEAEVRGRRIEAEVVPLPFYKR